MRSRRSHRRLVLSAAAVIALALSPLFGASAAHAADNSSPVWNTTVGFVQGGPHLVPPWEQPVCPASVQGAWAHPVPALHGLTDPRSTICRSASADHGFTTAAASEAGGINRVSSSSAGSSGRPSSSAPPVGSSTGQADNPPGCQQQVISGQVYTICYAFNGVETNNYNYLGGQDTIYVNAGAVPNGGYSHLSAWVMGTVNGTTTWDQVGWAMGDSCGEYATPELWTEFTYNGGHSDNCYPGTYPLSEGTSYSVANYYYGTGGGFTCMWENYVYWMGSWQGFDYHSTNNCGAGQIENFQEWDTPQGGAWPYFSSNQYFSGGALDPNNGCGCTVAWDYTQPTTYINSAAYLDYGQVIETQWSAFEILPYVSPSFSMYASPSSITVPPGMSGSSTIYLYSNSAFDNDVTFTVYYPSGSSASMNPGTVYLPENSSTAATLSVTTGLTQLSNYTVTVVGCGQGVCSSASVQVNVL